LTIGRNRAAIGFNFQRTTFDRIEGRKLAGGQIKVYTGVFGVFFEDALDLKLSSSTAAFFANYGVTDRLDVGVTLPIVRVAIDGTLTSRIGNSVTGVAPDATPFLYEDSGSASGVGDIVLRAKYNFLTRPGGGLAAGIDLRLPTGDELDLLGIAGRQAKLYLAASTEVGRLSPHVNIGGTVSGASDAANDPDTFVFPPSDEVNFAAGVDVAATPRVTVAVDVIGRTLRDAGRLREVATEFGGNFRELEFRDGDLQLTLAALGVKFNLFANTLVSASVLLPVGDGGLTDRASWAIGIDRTF
jgi:hypothetical protein